MIVTELSSSSEDSEECVQGEVVEPENEVDYDSLNKSLEYYLDDEDENNEFHKSILKSLVSSRLSRIDSDSDLDLNLEDRESSNDFNVESFGRTFKTLVDIVTEPMTVECPTTSSGSSEASENDESLSFIPTIKKISSDFIKKTSKFFKADNNDVVTLDSQDSCENLNEEVIKSELNDEELEENNQLPEMGASLENTAESCDKIWFINNLAKWF